MYYSIDTISRLTGLNPFTLRNWERRYGYPRPRRQPDGSRIYSVDQAIALKTLALLVGEGRAIRDLILTVKEGSPLSEPKSPDLPVDISQSIESLYTSLVRFDQKQAEQILATLALRLSPDRLLELVYQALLERIGSDWEDGRIRVFHEHFTSAFLRMKLAVYLNYWTPMTQATARSALCATLPDEVHEGGSMIFMVHLKRKGWDINYMGPHLSMDQLRKAVEAISPTTVCLSFTRADLLKEHLPALKRLPLTVCIGGRAVHELYDNSPRFGNVQLFNMKGDEAAELIDLYDFRKEIPSPGLSGETSS
ncbi:MAG TPA: hypothetical protein DCS07_04845 [Bdellovibrionales bacterium]|nr:MAG: hypothetical protein A2X97_12085 [Bdellovibrionales bacterium GWA1_52_35]HAR41947.1 hypothetical protein [Bdellovibrionales bacterium]HCM38799.1 hypothetical protein [Bdellovibrionales bacterium]